MGVSEQRRARKKVVIIIKLAHDKLNISVTEYYYELEITRGTIMYSATD